MMATNALRISEGRSPRRVRTSSRRSAPPHRTRLIAERIGIRLGILAVSMLAEKSQCSTGKLHPKIRETIFAAPISKTAKARRWPMMVRFLAAVWDRNSRSETAARISPTAVAGFITGSPGINAFNRSECRAQPPNESRGITAAREAAINEARPAFWPPSGRPATCDPSFIASETTVPSLESSASKPRSLRRLRSALQFD